MKNINKHISLTLKALRSEKAWSLDKTAQETGVSKAMLGQIEREESSPTITTLWKIACGFNTSFSSFLEDIDVSAKASLHRSGQQKLTPIDEKIIVTPLFPFDDKLNCEIFIIELQPFYEHLSLPHKPGVIEHVIVVDGTMQVLLNDICHTLQKGEGLRFDANQSHGYRNISSKCASFHNIIHYSISMSNQMKPKKIKEK